MYTFWLWRVGVRRTREEGWSEGLKTVSRISSNSSNLLKRDLFDRSVSVFMMSKTVKFPKNNSPVNVTIDDDLGGTGTYVSTINRKITQEELILIWRFLIRKLYFLSLDLFCLIRPSSFFNFSFLQMEEASLLKCTHFIYTLRKFVIFACFGISWHLLF